VLTGRQAPAGRVPGVDGLVWDADAVARPAQPPDEILPGDGGGVPAAAVALPLYVLPTIREQHHEARVRALKPVVETAYGVLETYEAQERAGALTREQAQSAAKALLEGLRHAGAEYFWVNDESTRLVMHPYLPNMVGKDMSGYRDPLGKAVFTEVVAVAKEKGEGALHDAATRANGAGGTDYIPKVSYVKRFAPWGWVLGTGVYVEDIEREVAGAQRRLLLGLAVAVVLAGVVGVGFSRHVVRPVRMLADAARRVATGDLSVKVPVASEDEVGRLGEAFNTVVGPSRRWWGGWWRWRGRRRRTRSGLAERRRR